MKKYLHTLALLLSIAFCDGVFAIEHEVGQRNKKFSPETLTVKVGDSVNFANHDPFFHNVFSLSETIVFDLGSYEKGKSKAVTFDAAGTVEVECAIHPYMMMTIVVE